MRTRGIWVPYIVLITGVVLTTGVTELLWQRAAQKDTERFHSYAQQTHDAIASRLETYLNSLRDTRAFLQATGRKLTRAQFKTYIEEMELQIHYPGIQGIGYSQRINPDQKKAFIEQARKSGVTDFQIWPDFERPEYHAILYLEPQDRRNQAALGYDMFTEPVRREAMQRAMDSGMAAASGRVTLVQEIFVRKQPGFLIYLPMYAPLSENPTAEERRQKIEGFVYSPFRIADLFQGIFGENVSPRVDFAIYDGPDTPENLIYQTEPDASNHTPAHEELIPLNIGGRTWELRVTPRPLFEQFSLRYQGTLALILGSLVTLALFGLTLSDARIRAVAERSANEARSAEAETLQHREWLRVTLSSIGDAVIATDRNGTINFLNAVAEKLCGWSSKDAVGQPLDSVLKIIDERTSESVVSAVAEVVRSGANVTPTIPTALISKTGEQVPVENTASPIRGRSGELLGVVVVFRNATQRRRAEQTAKMQAQHSALRAYIGANFASKRFLLREVLQKISDAVASNLGISIVRICTQDEHIGKLSMQAQSGRSDKFIPEGTAELGLITKEAIPYICEDTANDARLRHVEWLKHNGINTFAAFPLILEGRVLGVIAAYAEKKLEPEILDSLASIADILANGIERRRYEDALRDAETRFRMMADTAPVMIFTTKPDKSRDYFNKTWLQFTGRSLEEEHGSKWKDGVHPDDVAEASRIYEQAFDRREEYKMEYRLRRADGEYRWIVANGIPRYTRDGQFIGYIGSCIDIHERKLSELHEKSAREEAEKLSRMKDDFLAILSHELRTPLTPILGWTRILRSGKIPPPEVARAIDVIERNAKAQAALIEDLLDVSRIVAGKLTLDMRSVELARVVEAAIDAVKAAADEKQVKLAFESGEAPVVVKGDSTRLQQVVWNLLTNAVKFTPHGGKVEVSLSRNRDTALLKVSDTGEGIAAQDLDRIFDRFTQADSSATRSHGGLGLGLSIVKHLIELHRGSVGASSPGLGKGATFTVQLPCLSHQAQQDTRTITRKVPLADSLAGVRALLVEDEADARDLISFLLKKNGAVVESAASAREALQKLHSFNPDIMISDIGMPGEDGIDLIRKLRSSGSTLPAIALTAFARTEDKARALQAGYQQHISKPVEPAELISAVRDLRRFAETSK